MTGDGAIDDDYLHFFFLFVSVLGLMGCLSAGGSRQACPDLSEEKACGAVCRAAS